jgi:hypothetical protein
MKAFFKGVRSRVHSLIAIWVTIFGLISVGHAQYLPETVIFQPLYGQQPSPLFGALWTSTGDAVVTAESAFSRSRGLRIRAVNYISPETRTYVRYAFDTNGRLTALRMSGGLTASFRYAPPSDPNDPNAVVRITSKVWKGRRLAAVVRQDVSWVQFNGAIQEAKAALLQLDPRTIQAAPATSLVPRLAFSASVSSQSTATLEALQGIVKVGGIATSMFVSGVAFGTGNIPVGIMAAAGAIGGIMDLIDDSARVRTANEVLSVSDMGQLTQAIVKMARNGSSFGTILRSRIRNVSFYGVLFSIADSLLEREISSGRRGSVSLSPDSTVVITYSWPSGQRDLDTATTFLGHTLGYKAESVSTYMQWSSDNRGTGGEEVTQIFIGQAVLSKQLPPFSDIDCAAGWYAPAGGYGAATLSIKVVSSGESGVTLSKSIAPGQQTGVASTKVGRIKLTYGLLDVVTGRLTYQIQ